MKHDINTALRPLLTITEEWFSNILSDFTGELTDNLIAKAENTPSVTVQSDCFTALHSLQKTTKTAIPVFISALTKYFQTSTARQIPDQTLSDASFPDKMKKEALNLIATKDWEENLSFDTAVEKITQQNHEEFNHLEIRIIELLKSQSEYISKNPLSAENILTAFRESLQLFDFSPGIRIHVYKLFEKFLSQRISELLKKLNGELIREGILPEIVTDYSIKRENNKKSVPVDPEDVHPEANQATEHQAETLSSESYNPQPYRPDKAQLGGINIPINTPTNLNLGNNEPLSQNISKPIPGNMSSQESNNRHQNTITPVALRARRTSNTPNSSLNNRYLDLAKQLSKSKIGTSAPTLHDPSSQVNFGQSQSSNSFEQNNSVINTDSSQNNLYSLKQVYENRPQTVTSYVNEHTTTTQELIDALAGIQYNRSPNKTYLETSTASVSEKIKDSILTQTNKTPETTQLKNNKLYLIDMIEDLFTHIADNKKLSSSSKELFRRLMIPVIHLSLIDETFIDNAEHPARLFLEDFSDASLGITDSSESKNTPIYLKLKKITLQLGNENKINSSVFFELNQDLNRFINYRKQQANQKSLSPHTSVSKKIDAIIEHCIKDETLPKGLIVFLNKIWKNVMLSIYLDEQSNSETRAKASAFISSLIFSIKPAKTALGKKRLERLVLIINNELAEGMTRIKCPEPIKEKVTLYLANLHNSALGITTPKIKEIIPPPEEDKIIFRNELFDDTQFSQKNKNNHIKNTLVKLEPESTDSDSNDLALFDMPINEEAEAKVVSSLEEAFIEQPTSSMGSEKENNRETKFTSVDKTTETPNFTISKLLINKPISNTAEKESKTDFELIRLVNNSYKMQRIDDEYTSSVKNILEDSWLEFRFKSRYSRAKVTWIKEDKSQFNCLTQNNRIIEISLEALSESFRDGIASIVQSTSIIDEAIKAVSQSTASQTKNQ